MSLRPLYNGSARIGCDNNSAQPLLVRFLGRASTAALNAADELIDNATFQATAGATITLNYDFRKFGSGTATGPPTFAKIRLFNTDDSNDATTGFVAESADLIANNALPRTGTVNFAPTSSGTYRLQIEMRRGAGDFGGTSTDWTAFSDGSFQRGGLAQPTRANVQDKGRLRYGHNILGVAVTDRGLAAPGTFAVTMNTGGTALEEAVRLQSTQNKTQNKSDAARHIYKFKQRRNGTSTIDLNASTTIISTTAHRTEHVVHRLNYPVEGAPTTYDTVITVETNDALHDNNTPQYTGLADPASASGAWVHLVLVDGTTDSSSNAVHGVNQANHLGLRGGQ